MKTTTTGRAVRHVARIVGWLLVSIAVVVLWLVYTDKITNQYPHAYLVEFVQLVTAVHALIFCLWCLWDAWKDRAALRAANLNGARLGIATGNVWSEFNKALVLTLFIVVGQNAIRYPPPDDSRAFDARHEANERYSIAVNRTGLMLASIVLLIDSIRERRSRLTHVRSMRGLPRSVWAPPPGRSSRAEDYPQPPDDKLAS